jgi:hypothetical protein
MSSVNIHGMVMRTGRTHLYGYGMAATVNKLSITVSLKNVMIILVRELSVQVNITAEL